MATYHCQIKPARQVSAAKHADYVECEGRYKKKGEELEYKESGNMPEWAKDNPKDFWKASDELERKNATRYREIEVALPRELTKEQRIELARDFVAVELKNHTYTFAIHNTKASDGKEQPHAHIMFCERTLDGIEREREKYFSRPSTAYRDRKTGEMKPADPSKGGTKKADRWCGTSPQKARNVEKVRERWATMTNRALERAEKPERVDHRSLADQGIDRVSAKHRGPVATAMGNRFEETSRHAINRSINALNQSKQLSKQLIAVKLEHAAAKGAEIRATTELETVKLHAAQIKVAQEKQKTAAQVQPVQVQKSNPLIAKPDVQPVRAFMSGANAPTTALNENKPTPQQPAVDVQPVQLTMTGPEIKTVLSDELYRLRKLEEAAKTELQTIPEKRERLMTDLVYKHVPEWSKHDEKADKIEKLDNQCQEREAAWLQAQKDNGWKYLPPLPDDVGKMEQFKRKTAYTLMSKEQLEWQNEGTAVKEWRSRLDPAKASLEQERQGLQAKTDKLSPQINGEADQLMTRRAELSKQRWQANGDQEPLRKVYQNFPKGDTPYQVTGRDASSIIKDVKLLEQIKERKELENTLNMGHSR